MPARATVPCNGCTSCCKEDMIILHPEKGDRVEEYTTTQVSHPFTGKAVHMLAHKADGGCIYLGEEGCTIWSRAPVICREFDCRRMYLKFTSSQRRQMTAAGVLSRETLAAGKARLGSL